MNDHDRAVDRERAVAALRELIEALDRGVPRVERLGELRIAREAAALRQEAAKRLEELTAAQRGRRAVRPRVRARPPTTGGRYQRNERNCRDGFTGERPDRRARIQSPTA